MINCIEDRMDKYVRYIIDRLTDNTDSFNTRLKIYNIPVCAHRITSYTGKNITDGYNILKLVRVLNEYTISWDIELSDGMLYLNQSLCVPVDEVINIASSISYIFNRTKDIYTNCSKDKLIALIIDEKDIIHVDIVAIDNELSYGELKEFLTLTYVLSHSVKDDLYDYFDTLDN